MIGNLLTSAQAAEVLGFKEKTLRNWRCSGEGPPFASINGNVRYRPEDLEAWVAARVRTSTSDTGEQAAVKGGRG